MTLRQLPKEEVGRPDPSLKRRLRPYAQAATFLIGGPGLLVLTAILLFGGDGVADWVNGLPSWTPLAFWGCWLLAILVVGSLLDDR